MSRGVVRGWEPPRTWVAVIGTLEWKHEEQFDPFPTENRRDAALVEFFRQVGVPDRQILYLRDHEATRRGIEQGLTALLPQARPGDLLFFYYCGHGYLLDSGAACFAPYDAGGANVPAWPMASVPELIERHFGGDKVLLMADCCLSGTLAGAVMRRGGRVSYACLTSSSAMEMSTGNWTFTEAVLAGLRGLAFADDDASGTITLKELAEQVLGDMAFAEEQLASFATTGSFDPLMILAPARRKPHAQVGRRVEVYSGGHWYKARIVDADAARFKVHYYGWEESDQEWVTRDHIREVTPVQYAVGAPVEVRWKRKWYPATVLDLRGGVHYIQYDDYGPEWNEWASSKRLRLPKN